MSDNQRAAVFVTAEELGAELATPNPPIVLDVRWELPPAGQKYDGRSAYLAGHLPGAVFVDLDTELAAPPTPKDGRHPLPTATTFQRAVRRWGVNPDSKVVVYDAATASTAARAWWLLKYFGFDAVRILEGGLAAWQDAGLPVSADDVTREPGRFVVNPGHMSIISAEQAAKMARAPESLLIDARAPERYRGEIEPVDARAGHIPGAVNVPTARNLNLKGLFQAAKDLRELYAAAGVQAALAAATTLAVPARKAATPTQAIGVYCGSGVTATHDIAALASIGIDASLYPGSWSQWAANPDLPVVKGDTP